jgi:hypothetical protein
MQGEDISKICIRFKYFVSEFACFSELVSIQVELGAKFDTEEVRVRMG